MTEWIHVAILAVLQGITEFLPVSSSGHLVLAEHFLKVEVPGVLLEVTLHLGTLLAVLWYYRRRLLELMWGLRVAGGESGRYLAAILAGTIPAGLVYVMGGDAVESLFERPLVVAGMLMVTGVILLSMRLAVFAREEPGVTARNGFLVGVAQSVALLPGISRSGMTIVAGRHLGWSPERAAEFSLLLSVPAQAGAGAVTFYKALGSGGPMPSMPLLAVGMAVAAVTGYGAIVVLMRLLKKGALWTFGAYCLAVGLVVAILVF